MTLPKTKGGVPPIETHTIPKPDTTSQNFQNNHHKNLFPKIL